MSIPAVIDAEELRALLGSGTPPHLLDVRTPGEFQAVHIPGTHNVPLDLLRQRKDAVVRRFDRDVVLVCRSGQRAAQAQAILRAAGVVNAHVLTGGIMAWESRGFDVNRGVERWDLERQVRLVAGSIVLSSVLASAALPRLKWIAATVGAGLTGAALTNTCAMGMLLSRLPYNRGPRCEGAAK